MLSAFASAIDLDSIAATITDEIAGAGTEHLSATGIAYRIEELWELR
jgi:hypothetical protein